MPKWIEALMLLDHVAQRPGRAARLAEFKSNSGAFAMAKQLREFAELNGTASEWEFSSGRREKGSYCVWARYTPASIGAEAVS